jgi:dTDP-D-glucose 4,6-dehydratase
MNTFYHNEKATYYNYDIADYSSCRALYEGVDYVFHLAAESRIQPAIKKSITLFSHKCLWDCCSSSMFTRSRG